MLDLIRVVVVTNPSIEVATATMQSSGGVVYTGKVEVLKPVVDEALRGKKNRKFAFRALKKRGWSNAYLMIDLKGSS
jgi:hypothetical protein